MKYRILWKIPYEVESRVDVTVNSKTALMKWIDKCVDLLYEERNEETKKLELYLGFIIVTDVKSGKEYFVPFSPRLNHL